ncbi:hypothetical protein HDU97_008857 [Phlyctochytrium planicorne]|nr:hypothetical protein HDU97_008857 [Phlyctochytrium planicorne]
MRLSSLLLAAIAGGQSAFGLSSFAYGFGGSATQLEGSWDVDGRKESVYDRWYHSPERAGQPNADVAADHYRRWREDVGYLVKLKATAYRFSVSWSRILPDCTGNVNPLGVKFYSDLINELLANNIEPFLTMFHWDLPQACMDRFQGFVSREIIDAFAEYANVLYDNYGDRVNYWLTLNEAESNCEKGYATNFLAPGLNGGEKVRYQCIYYSHLMHATVVKNARKNYPQAANWKFGYPAIITHFEPMSPQYASVAISKQNAQTGLYIDPVVFGDYSVEAKEDSNIVPFSTAEKALLKGTVDFTSLNYYTAAGVGGNLKSVLPSGVDWQTVYPKGVRDLCNYYYARYGLDIFVTETGYPEPGEDQKATAAEVADDKLRTQFWQMTIGNITAAVEEDGVPVKGLLVWALLDNMEWRDYIPRFGAIAVDFKNGTLDRTIKSSTLWIADYYNSRKLKSPFPKRITAPTISIDPTITSPPGGQKNIDTPTVSDTQKPTETPTPSANSISVSPQKNSRGIVVGSLLVATLPLVASYDMLWGFGGSSMQIEGAWDADGKSPSVYDHWFHTDPSKAGAPNADKATDHYHRWKEDVGYMAQLKATAYRFSISWPRILPNCTGTVNEAGVKFYSDLIDELIKNNIEPFLTMYHWDMPQVCWERYQGFLNKDFVDVFAQYAKVLYDRFGDRYWLTLNELEANCQFSYATGIFAPGNVGGEKARGQCIYISHLIHGTVVNLARKNYPQAKNWKFGLPSIFPYFEAFPGSEAQAAQQQNAISALFFDPVVYGDYGAEVKGDPNLPSFTAEESAMLKGTMDFSAVNYYSASGVGGNLPQVLQSGIDWQFVYPKGVRGLVNYFYKRYNLDVYLTEIGYPVPGEKDFKTAEQVANDDLRRQFWEMTVTNLTLAITEDKVPVKGIIVWALLDNFEWVSYDPKFGQIGVDMINGTLNRVIKKSSFFLSDYYASQNLSSPAPPRTALPAASSTGKPGTNPTNTATAVVTSTPAAKGNSGATALLGSSGAWSKVMGIVLALFMGFVAGS